MGEVIEKEAKADSGSLYNRVTPSEVRSKLEELLKEDDINIINQTEWFIKWWYEKHTCRMDYYLRNIRS